MENRTVNEEHESEELMENKTAEVTGNAEPDAVHRTGFGDMETEAVTESRSTDGEDSEEEYDEELEESVSEAVSEEIAKADSGSAKQKAEAKGGKKKWTREKNYSDSYRGLMTELMLTCGLTTTDGMKLLDGNTRMMRKALLKMQNERLTETKNYSMGKIASYLKQPFGSEYIGKVKIGYMNYFKTISEIMRNSAYCINNPKYQHTAVHSFLTSELTHYMYAAGINTLWSQKESVTPILMPSMEDGTDRPVEEPLAGIKAPSFYFSREMLYEASKEINANASIVNAKRDGSGEDSTASNRYTRSIGVLFGDSSYYTVYRLNGRMVWPSKSESSFRTAYEKIAVRLGYLEYSKGKAIFYAESSVFRQMVFPPEDYPQLYDKPPKKKKGKKTERYLSCGNLASYDYVPYDEIYALPVSTDSMNLTLQMTKEGWDEELIAGHKDSAGNYLLDGILTSRLGAPGRGYGVSYMIPADALQPVGEDQQVHSPEKFYFVFCVPRLVAFSRFLNLAYSYTQVKGYENSASCYTVYCYPWQHEMLNEICQGIGVTITEVEEKILDRETDMYQIRSRGNGRSKEDS